jgi:DNA repair protein RadC
MSSITVCAERRRPAAVPSPLYIRIGGKFEPLPDDVLLKHMRTWAGDRFRSCTQLLECPEVIEAFLLSKLAARQYEVFALVLLNRRNRLIEYVEVSRGTLDIANVYTREVVRLALRHNASAVIFAHNHPGGDSTPSASDVNLTRRLQEALVYVDVRVIDHLVIGKTVTSLAKRGLLRA